MIVKDAMVLIHLAKISLLEASCEHFKKVIIPAKVYGEILLGEEKGYPDAVIIKELVQNKKIKVKEIGNKSLLKKAEEFNIQRGEAEALALYWQEKAKLLATDDNNIRKKSVILNINIIGTPAIVLKLFICKRIKKEKFIESLSELREIGWFSNPIIDKIMMEGLKWGKQ